MTMCAKRCSKCFKPIGNFTCGDMGCQTGRDNLERLRVGNLEKDNKEQQATINRLERGLRDIKKHLDLIGGSAVAFSSTYMIATKALREPLTESKDLDVLRDMQIKNESKLKEDITPSFEDMNKKFDI